MAGIDNWASIMAIDAGPTMTGNVLEDRQHAAVEQRLADHPSEAADAARIASIGPVTDDRVGARYRQVEHRVAVYGDTQPREIIGDETRGQARGTLGRRVRQGREARGGRVDTPMRRLQPRYPATLLVDQYGGGAAHRFEQGAHQIAHLIRRAAITPKQDKSDRTDGAEKIALEAAQSFA